MNLGFILCFAATTLRTAIRKKHHIFFLDLTF